MIHVQKSAQSEATLLYDQAGIDSSYQPCGSGGISSGSFYFWGHHSKTGPASPSNMLRNTTASLMQPIWFC